jgi:hypothetical protein
MFSTHRTAHAAVSNLLAAHANFGETAQALGMIRSHGYNYHIIRIISTCEKTLPQPVISDVTVVALLCSILTEYTSQPCCRRG